MIPEATETLADPPWIDRRASTTALAGIAGPAKGPIGSLP